MNIQVLNCFNTFYGIYNQTVLHVALFVSRLIIEPVSLKRWLSIIRDFRLDSMGQMGLTGFVNKVFFFFNLFLAVLGLCCYTGFLLAVVSGGYSLAAGLQDFHCGDVSCFRAWALGYAGFSSCGMWAQQLPLPGARAQAQWLWCMG